MGQRRRSRAGDAAQSTPRAQMKTLNVEVPGYAWIAIKTLAAQQMVSVRHVIMSALKANGIEIKDADMIEDGRNSHAIFQYGEERFSRRIARRIVETRKRSPLETTEEAAGDALPPPSPKPGALS